MILLLMVIEAVVIVVALHTRDVRRRRHNRVFIKAGSVVIGGVVHTFFDEQDVQL